LAVGDASGLTCVMSNIVNSLQNKVLTIGERGVLTPRWVRVLSTDEPVKTVTGRDRAIGDGGKGARGGLLVSGG